MAFELGLPKTDPGQVRKFGTEISLPYSDPQPCRVSTVVGWSALFCAVLPSYLPRHQV